MRYIGPFFRMNSLSHKEISGQLFHLSKESVKTLALQSKCGILSQFRISKKSSIDDISILNNFSPLLCLYRKASPLFIHSKSSQGFDESTFKKEINPATNALMTLSLLELSEYYSHYNDNKRNVDSLEKPYKYLAKEQLQFYSENLRNNEGLFVDKKNMSDGNSKGFSLVDKDEKIDYSDQAFMMAAYLLYSYHNKTDPNSSEYFNFSYEILDMFKNYKSVLYDLSFNENLLIFLALNIFYKYSLHTDAKKLILDLGDFLITKFQEKDYYSESIDDCALFSICLMDAYKHTGIITFKEVADEITDRLISLYDSDKSIFIKEPDKKESKYSCSEITFYLLCLLMHSFEEDKVNELKPIISGVYRKFFINSSLLTSWPEAPTLDEIERYKKLSLRSADMIDETYFRMPILPTPKGTGCAPVFIKNLTYSKKKDSLSTKKASFDSNKNMLNFFLIIYLLKDIVKDFMEFTLPLDTDKTIAYESTSEPSNTSKKDIVKLNSKEINEIIQKSDLAEFSKDHSDTQSLQSDDLKNNSNSCETNVYEDIEKPILKGMSTTKKVNTITSLNKEKNRKVASQTKNKNNKKSKNTRKKKK